MFLAFAKLCVVEGTYFAKSDLGAIHATSQYLSLSVVLQSIHYPPTIHLSPCAMDHMHLKP